MLKLLCLYSVLILISNRVLAQDFASMFSPHQPAAIIGLEGSLGDPSRWFDARAAARLYNDEKQNITMHGRWRRLGFKDSDARLANYDDVEGGLTYRRHYGERKFWSLSTSYGSSSDQAFKSADVSILNVTGLVKFNERWFGAVNYSNNRTFANNVPLPGFFYIHTMTQNKILIFGLPFAFIKVPLGDQFSFNYLGILPWRHNLKIAYEASSIKPYFFIEHAPQSFIPSERQKDEDRFIWAKRDIGLGLSGNYNKLINWDLAGGYSFAQEFYIAENFNDKNKSGIIRPDNAAFITLALKFQIH